MHGGNRCSIEVFKRKVTIRYRIERVRRRAIKAERSCRHVTVNRIGRTGKGSRTQRVFVDTGAAIGNAPAITAKHFDISQKMMTKGDRLGGLQVGEARHDGFSMGFCLCNQGFLKSFEADLKIAKCNVTDPEFEVGRDLIIA